VNFGLSEEQELLQETVRGYAANECPASRLREIFDGEELHDETLWRGLAEMGVAGLALPERYGGAGMEMIDLALVAEVLGHAALPGPFLGHSLAAQAILLGGSDAQREQWLPRLAAGEALGSVAIAEPGDRWDPATLELRVEDGRLSGEKGFVPHASAADVIVVALADGGLALVERGADGLKIEGIEAVDRTRRVEQLTFEGTPAELLPQAAGARLRDAGLVLLAADAFGGAWRLIEDSTEYAKTREQFGQQIAMFQSVKHKLADMAVEIEPSRGLYWYAAHAFDHLPDEAERAAALAKAHITDRFMQVARDAVEVHGGIGFTWECDVQIWFKRAMFDRAFLGGPVHHRERCAELAGW
jgi:alkylation response protein AidB-like acyl-CoA dehydrogenase